MIYNGAGPLTPWLEYDQFNNLTQRQNSFYEYEDRFEATYANIRQTSGVGDGSDLAGTQAKSSVAQDSLFPEARS